MRTRTLYSESNSFGSCCYCILGSRILSSSLFLDEFVFAIDKIQICPLPKLSGYEGFVPIDIRKHDTEVLTRAWLRPCVEYFLVIAIN